MGCGNGRLVDCFKANVDYLGIDNSHNILEIAKLKYPNNNFELIENLSTLPYAESYFDKIYCLAVFHHIPTIELRTNVLRELYRVLNKNGMLYLTVWDLTTRKGYENIVERSAKVDSLEEGDLLLPLFSPDQKDMRYVHQFTESELKDIVTDAKYTNIEMTITKRGLKDGQSNIQLICKK